MQQLLESLTVWKNKKSINIVGEKMAKKFLTLKDVENCICEGKLYLEEKVILSSSLKDYLREKDIEIVYGKVENKVQECFTSVEKVEAKQDIEKLIEKILRTEFSVNDEQKIRQVIKIVGEVLK